MIATAPYTWGASGDIPVHEDYDGDGKTDVAVFDPLKTTWSILRSSTSFMNGMEYQWGDIDASSVQTRALWRMCNEAPPQTDESSRARRTFVTRSAAARAAAAKPWLHGKNSTDSYTFCSCKHG
jgi:hypothetical protein